MKTKHTLECHPILHVMYPWGGTDASWLVDSSTDIAVWVQAILGKLCCVLGQDPLLTVPLPN